ncbi:MAG: hypothetical protein HFJ58_00905 [Clostridia bacterium]|nr:hypothetical protein [Clostridia bacterium]
MFLHGYDDNTLELCFGAQDKNRNFITKLMKNANTVSDNGIEGLSKIANSGKITPEIIQNYTHVVYRNRLEILYGYRNMQERSTKEEYLKTLEFYKDIIQNANKYYDMVLVDLDKKLNNDIIRQILKISDVLVYNIEQKMNMINEFLKMREELDSQSKNKIVLNVGNFDENSKYTIKNISRYAGIRRDLTVIPYNTLFFEAASEEAVADLFLKIINVSEADKNSKFIKQVKETVEKIIYKMQEVQMKM